jgi:hypothetical protein
VAIEDEVDGRTAGALTLSETATGGDAGSGWSGAGSAGGSATILQHREPVAGSLSATNWATGGRGGTLDGSVAPIAAPAGRGGDALTDVALTNQSGPIALSDLAIAGSGGAVKTKALAVARGGDGGNASGRSVGSAIGDAAVSVSDPAVGGGGGSTPANGVGGVGGSASSTAIATGGSGAVNASAWAYGGWGGAGATTDPSSSGRAGDATAVTRAVGFGEVNADANAWTGGRAQPGARALAASEATGASGTIHSLAGARSNEFDAFDVEAWAPVTGLVRTESDVSLGGLAPTAKLADAHAAFGNAIALPGAGVRDAALASNPNVAASFAAAVTTRALAIATLGAIGGDAPSGTAQGALLDLSWTSALGTGDELALGFLDPVIAGEGFSTLHVSAVLDGEDVFDKSFTDAEDASTFFDDRAFLFMRRDGAAGPGTLEFEMDFKPVAAGDGFSISFLVAAVPEPGSIVLVGAGLGCLASRRRVGASSRTASPGRVDHRSEPVVAIPIASPEASSV